jgi:K+-transporting ATPase ATPase C chain
MLRATVSSVIAIVLMTAVLGLAYPLVMTGFAQVAFSSQANGSLIDKNGKVIGSKLVAQGFTGSRYFHPRPTATSPPYTAGGTWMGGDTTFANLGPTNSTLAQNVRKEANAILKLERPYNPGLTIHEIPVDAVVTSGSGIDPDISEANAQLQSHRVAAVRHLPLATVEQLISKYTIGRSWGFFGEPGVNVLELNLALDRLGTA